MNSTAPAHDWITNRRMKFAALFPALLLGVLFPQAYARENLDRGVVALPTGTGKMYVGWRLLQSDPPGVGFNVYRMEPGRALPYGKINKTPVTNSTNFVDTTVAPGLPYRYVVKVVIDGKESDCPGTGYARAFNYSRPYVSIQMQGNYVPNKVAIADLDGDGALDFVIQQPAFNTDPGNNMVRRATADSTAGSVKYRSNTLWRPSKQPYNLEAYDSKGRFMWRYDMGWAIESGTWYAPFVVYDLDGDGCAEIYTKAGDGDTREPYGAVVEGPEYLVRLDGRTGKVTGRTDWGLSRDGFKMYNRYSRNYLAIAYLNGREPSLVMSRGTYNMLKTAAYDKDLRQLWYWESTGEYESYRGQAEHGLTAADVDGDGRDELILGAAALSHDGKGLWNTGTGHGNVCLVADIDPAHPGLEVFKGRETKTESEKGLSLISAVDGKPLWSIDKPREKGVADGIIGDFDPNYPGMECYAVANDLDVIWFYAADGRSIFAKNINTKGAEPLWWDADPQKEVLQQGQIAKFGRVDSLEEIEGKVIAIADVIGDWREEVITALDGELRIYSTTLPADSARPCLMQDKLYRTNVAAFFSMGYMRAPQLGGRPLP